LKPTLNLGQLKRLAAAAIEQPDLIALGLSGRDEVNDRYFPSGLKRGDASLSVLEGDLAFALSVDADRPDVAAGLVFRRLICDTTNATVLPFWRALRSLHVLNLAKILERQPTLLALRGRHVGRRDHDDEPAQYEFHGHLRRPRFTLSAVMGTSLVSSRLAWEPCSGSQPGRGVSDAIS